MSIVLNSLCSILGVAYSDVSMHKMYLDTFEPATTNMEQME
jgi:hypothetical protein